MAIAGIDGCRKGWIMVKYDGRHFGYGVYESLRALTAQNPEIETAFIDMPVGLGSLTHPRTVEQLLRKALRPRHSTVFNPPCRAAVYIPNHQLARIRNLEVEGKSLSVQSLNISPKIRELDELIQVNNDLCLIESHPELCFKALNGGKVLLSKKSAATGVDERLNLLDQYGKWPRELYGEMLDATLRKEVKKDDILDAICLCLSLKLAGDGPPDFLEDEHRFDEKGIPIRIGYYQLK